MGLSRRTRRTLLVSGLALCIAALGFSLGAWYSQRRLEERIAAAVESQSSLATEVTHHLTSEMGLMPISMLRERRRSFVEVNAYDEFGSMRYSTAGYLGDGYFITVKHGVMPLNENQSRTASVVVLYNNEPIPATVVDSGTADAEVHPGDWAIIKVDRQINLPPLSVDLKYDFDFADPIFRLGNDYSKGIILSTGYIGQRTSNGLVTSLTDGHPGVSGGGVLNRDGNLIGIPIGRMEADYRFSFILPVRQEMFRKVKHTRHAMPIQVTSRAHVSLDALKGED
jgi:S1-C subfamily serine protease